MRPKKRAPHPTSPWPTLYIIRTFNSGQHWPSDRSFPPHEIGLTPVVPSHLLRRVRMTLFAVVAGETWLWGTDG